MVVIIGAQMSKWLQERMIDGREADGNADATRPET